MTSRITTILFDFDGTLINTNELISASFTAVFDHYFPGRFTPEEVSAFNGPPLQETFRKVDPERAGELESFYRRHNWEYHDELASEFPGVYETLAVLHERGCRLGLVTTKKRDVVEKGLAFTRLAPFFETVVTIEDVQHAKPDPEPVLLALEQLGGVSPAEALMVGDNYHDILAGKNAGTKTAGVAWSAKGAGYLSRFEPDYMLESMGELLKITEGALV